LNNSLQEVHTAYTTAPHNPSQHNQASSHDVLTSLVIVLLMIGIMMPEHVEIDLIQEIYI
jgi:nitric oxide reductase large subunit